MSNNDDKHIEAYAHHKAALGAAHQISSAHQNYNSKAVNFHEHMAKQHFNKIKSHINVGHRQFMAEKKLPDHASLIGKPHPHDSLLDKAEEMSKAEKIYTDPVEILNLIKEGTKKALDELNKAQAMQMGANKNPGMPRGNYTGKTSIAKPEGAPKPITAPKPPTALKPPMPPKPPMAKAETDFEHHVVRDGGTVVSKHPTHAKASEAASIENLGSDMYHHTVVTVRKPKLPNPSMTKAELDKPQAVKKIYQSDHEGNFKTHKDGTLKQQHTVIKKPTIMGMAQPTAPVKVIKKDEANLEKGAIDEMKGAVSKMKETVAKMPDKGLKMVKPLPAGDDKTVITKPKKLPSPQENYGKDPHRGGSEVAKDLTKANYDEAVANGKKVDFSQEGKTGLQISDARPEHERKGLPAPKKRDIVDKIMGDMKAAQAAKVMNPPKVEPKKEDKPKMGLDMNKSENNSEKQKFSDKDKKHIEAMAHHFNANQKSLSTKKIPHKEHTDKIHAHLHAIDPAGYSSQKGFDAITEARKGSKHTEAAIGSSHPHDSLLKDMNKSENHKEKSMKDLLNRHLERTKEADKKLKRFLSDGSMDDTGPKVGSGEKVKKDEADLSKANIVPVKPKLGGRDPDSKMMTDQAMGQAHKDAKAPIASGDKVVLPTPAQHEERAKQFAEQTPKSHFDDLGLCAYCKSTESDSCC